VRDADRLTFLGAVDAAGHPPSIVIFAT